MDIEEIEKLVIDFQPGSSAYERNMLVKNELEERNYSKVLSGILIKSDASRSEKIYEDAEIEKAVSIEVYYK